MSPPPPPPRINSNDELANIELRQLYVQLLRTKNWERGRKKRGDDWKFRKRRGSWEREYRESSPLSVVDGRVVQGLNDEYTDRCRLKWKKDKRRARCVCKKTRKGRKERERESGEKKWKVEERIRQRREVWKRVAVMAHKLSLFLSLCLSLSLAEVFRRFHGSA